MIRLGRPSFETLLTWTFVLVGVLWGAFLGARQIAGIDSGFDRLEYLTLDWRFLLVGARPVPRGVVIAAVDDETLRAVGGYPLPRDVLARIVRELAAHDPRAIAIDMLFLDPGKPDADRALADALHATRSVVAAMGMFDNDQSSLHAGSRAGERGLAPAPSSVLWPIAAIRDAARTGLVNISTDYAGVPRYVPMIFQAGNTVLPSFALAASSTALRSDPVLGRDSLELAARTVSMDLGYHLPIRYYGPRGSVRQFSAARALRADLDADDVRGQVVLLGATAVGLGDTFATPFDRVVPGIEIFATAVSNILAGDGLVRTGIVRRIDATTAILLPGLTVLLMAVRRTVVGLVFAGLVFALWAISIFAAFLAGYWLSIAVPLAAVVPTAAGYGLTRLVLERYVAERLARDKATLSKFQPRLMVEHILANPQFLQEPVQQEVAVVFLDLSGFTGVAETLGPQWARDLLADFQALVERDVVEHDGYVVTFMGDGAMIIFGLPQARLDDASRALLTIRQLHRSLVAWLGALPPVTKGRMSVRIGGHVGPVVLSRLGAADHQHIAATGDTVNVTSRLLEVARQQRSSIVVSENLWKAGAGLAPFADRDMAGSPFEVDIRGRTQSLQVRVLD
jgi:adenylate cyclase